MKKSFKRSAALLLTAAMVSSASICALADGVPGVPATSAAQQTTAAATQTAAGLPLQEDQRVLDFYKDSVIIGDSVADGFNRFAQGNKTNPLMGELQFLTASRYSLHSALVPVAQDSTIAHPLYQGKFMNVWDSIQLMGAKHVYLFFGFNDLGDRPDTIVQHYTELIQKIKAQNPDTDFTIISTTYVYPGYVQNFKGVKSWAVDSKTVRKLNTEMKKKADANGWGYINVADRLADANGDLDPKYCSDQAFHQNADAYVIWAQCFREYAASKNFAH